MQPIWLCNILFDQKHAVWFDYGKINLFTASIYLFKWTIKTQEEDVKHVES